MNKINDLLNTLRQEGYHITEQRKYILAEFLKEKGHVSVDEFYLKLKRKNPKVSYTTVYRTLKLMGKYDIAKGVGFGDGTTRYESGKDHHEHLICLICGSVIEFVSLKIELEQNRILKKFGFLPQHHRLEIYGICKKCQEARSSKPGSA